MNKLLTTLILMLLFNQTTKAQLYVNDAFIYVADQSIFVKQDINLNTANSFIYLRNDSQILQGTTAASTNVGLGAVSVFQEGTSNTFAYNYWSSPVGTSNATVGNSNFGIAQLGAPTSNIATTFTAPLANGVSNGIAGTGTVQIAQRWIHTFISSLNYSGWTFIGTGAIAPGRGFTMKGTTGTDATTGTVVGAGSAVANNPGSAQRYDFRGKPNDGNINVSVAADQYTLAGNPYSSAIDLQLFYNQNSAEIMPEILFWEQPNATSTSHNLDTYKGGYSVYNAFNGVATRATLNSYDGSGAQTGVGASLGTYNRKFIPIGQGFMIMGRVGTSGLATFRNTQRVEIKEGVSGSVFNRNNVANSTANTYPNYHAIPNVAGIDYTQISTAPVPHILINGLLNNSGIKQMALVFIPAALDGYDSGDSISPNVDDNLPFDMYLFLNNTEYVHSAKAFALNNTFQLGFKNNVTASFKLQVSQFVNFDSANFVYLHDKVTNQYFDIKNNPYEFTIPAGVNNTRYEITFQTNLSTSDNSVLNSLNVYHNQVNKTVTVKNPKNINLKRCSLFDVSGKEIFTKNRLGSNVLYEFSTSNLSDGVYIVKVTSDDNESSATKITVYNSK